MLPVPDHASDPWPEIQAHLRRAVPPATYELWLDSLRLRALHGAAVELETAGDAAWISERFGRVLHACAAAVLGPEASVRVGGGDPPPAERPVARGGGDLNPKYTFDQFVIGAGNRLAHAASLAVAELPGSAYNPLFLCGPPGVGKTHLLHSIAHYLHTFAPSLIVRRTTIEDFTSHFVSAVQSGDMDRFKATYRHADVLLVDDVQFLASKARTEEEFFHTFNALHEAGSQLVLTSDRPPRDLGAVEDRLRDRFEAGLVTGIAPPDRDTRRTILRMRALADGLDLPDPAVLDLIADRVTDNIRALEGALIRIVAFHSLTGQALDAALVSRVLDDLYPSARPARRSIREIQELTSAAFGVTVDDLVSSSRTGQVTWPRHIAMYLSRAHTDSTLPAIGAAFGGRNHATVLNAVRRAESRLARDPDAAATVAGLVRALEAPPAPQRPDRPR